MPRIQLSDLNIPASLFVDISDFVQDGTIIKRKAEITGMDYSIRNQAVKLELRIHHYSNNEGAYGERLPDLNPTPFYKTLVADMSYLVAMDGTLLGPRSLEVYEAIPVEPNPESPDPLVTYTYGPHESIVGIDYMYEWEFFKMVAATQPVIVDQMLIQKVQIANQQGKI